MRLPEIARRLLSRFKRPPEVHSSDYSASDAEAARRYWSAEVIADRERHGVGDKRS